MEITQVPVLKFSIYLYVGSFNGALSSLTAHELGSVAIKGALEKAQVFGAEVSEVVLGQVLTAGQFQ